MKEHGDAQLHALPIENFKMLYLQSNVADMKNLLIDGPCKRNCFEKETFELYLF